MEVSPLPHKTPFASTQIEITSPTPISTPTVDDDDNDDEMMLDSPAPITRQGSLEPPKPLVAESVPPTHSIHLHSICTDNLP